jgi:hypothetical protein
LTDSPAVSGGGGFSLFLNVMARADTTQADILDAIVRRLIDQIDPLTEKTCFIGILPDGAPYRPADNLFVVVSPTGGQFPAEFVDGGGSQQLTENSGVLVTIFSRLMSQRQERDREGLASETRGLLTLKRQILRALTAHDLEWGGQKILRSLLVPSESSPADPAREVDNLVQLSIRFEVSFDWDLF